MTTTASLTLCQYCEHANPADAKFCTGCGAPLHLIPCPTCGAVNQKTSKSCYQCHGELRESTEILLANAPASASEAAAGDAESSPVMPSTPSTYSPPPAKPQRQPLFVVTIIFLAFASAAYFAYRQRAAVAAKEPGTEAASSTAPANLSAGTINKASPAPSANTSTTPAAAKEIAANPAPASIVAKPEKIVAPPEVAAADSQPATMPTRRANRRGAAETVAAPEITATAGNARASSGIEKTSPQARPCTEAIAALGLCTLEPTKGR